MEKINLHTTKRAELIDITGKIQEAAGKNKLAEGVCVVFCPHTTAGLTVNENADPSVKKDIIAALGRLVPENAGYAHGEGNADSHVKSSLFGSSVTVFVEKGQLMLGTWQAIYFCESDGPRSRQVWVTLLASSRIEGEGDA